MAFVTHLDFSHLSLHSDGDFFDIALPWVFRLSLFPLEWLDKLGITCQRDLFCWDPARIDKLLANKSHVGLKAYAYWKDNTNVIQFVDVLHESLLVPFNNKIFANELIFSWIVNLHADFHVLSNSADKVDQANAYAAVAITVHRGRRCWDPRDELRAALAAKRNTWHAKEGIALRRTIMRGLILLRDSFVALQTFLCFLVIEMVQVEVVNNTCLERVHNFQWLIANN